MKKRPATTLFMLMSLDGKISCGASDGLDFDKDLPRIKGVCEGLQQYYDIEQTTDLFSLNTGKVMAKIGINNRTKNPDKTDVSFVIIDRKSHLGKSGIEYLCKWLKRLILVTDNRSHDAFDLREKHDNLCIIYSQDVDLSETLCKLHDDFGMKNLTIQSGGTLNSEFLKRGLIDYIHIIVAPVLVGGADTPTLIDGESITNISQLKPLELLSFRSLENSYIELKYRVKPTN